MTVTNDRLTEEDIAATKEALQTTNAEINEKIVAINTQYFDPKCLSAVSIILNIPTKKLLQCAGNADSNQLFGLALSLDQKPVDCEIKQLIFHVNSDSDSAVDFEQFLMTTES